VLLPLNDVHQGPTTTTMVTTVRRKTKIFLPLARSACARVRDSCRYSAGLNIRNTRSTPG
jgi:hypothetical protein